MKKQKILLMISMIPLGNLSLMAQISLPNLNLSKQTVSYDISGNTFYNFDAGSDLKQIPTQEFLSFTPTEIKEHKTEYYTVDQNYITVIDHSINTEYPNWMKLPAKTIIDKNGFKSYDENGVVIAQQELGATGKEGNLKVLNLIKDRGLFVVPTFAPVSDVEMAILRTNGYTVSKDSDGAIHSRKDNHEDVYSPSQYYTASIEYDANNNETYRAENTYIRNEKLQIIPYETAEVYSNTTSNGICYKKIKYTAITNFTRGGTNNIPIDPTIRQTLNTVFAGGIKTYPNPASSVLNIDLPVSTSADNQFVDISIENVFGKVMQALPHQTSGTTVTMNISALPMNTYVVKVIWLNNGLKTARILKM